ncbi:hypothetical protein QCA50_016402 [Cerrena zonata]|uniref:Uncharacterized protein n=1 Tax=Cerrena zonata TaxID=2478898 RepID=A0AAW0FV85_9APHY
MSYCHHSAAPLWSSQSIHICTRRHHDPPSLVELLYSNFPSFSGTAEDGQFPLSTSQYCFLSKLTAYLLTSKESCRPTSEKCINVELADHTSINIDPILGPSSQGPMETDFLKKPSLIFIQYAVSIWRANSHCP